jgi:hypothetical protein
MITEGGENGADGVIELESGDVAALLETVQAFVPAGVLAALPPLARVSAAISGQPEDPAGPEPEPAQEQGQ